jgi:hypothetical protein
MPSLTDRAYTSLVAAGVNALIENGLNLSYESLSDFEKNALCLEPEEQKPIDVHFSIGDVRCVATSGGRGLGEERITILYGSTDLKRAKYINDCMNPSLGKGTAVKVTLERWRGPVIRKRNRSGFRCARADKAVLVNVQVQPMGYETRL